MEVVAKAFFSFTQIGFCTILLTYTRTKNTEIAMTIFQIQCFLSVAETLNFTEAANRLFIAQSSLSRNISHLEAELDLALFVRTKKYVRLTPAGTVLYAEFSKLLTMGENALVKARNAEKGENGYLRLGLLETQRSENFLPAKLNQLREKHPNVKIDIISGTFKDLRQAILDNLIDIAITLSFDLDDYPMDQIVYQIFFRSQPKCVISKSNPLASLPAFDWEMLSSETMIAISPEVSRGAYQNILQFCERHNFTPASIVYSNSIQNTLLRVEAGLGFSVLDENCISDANTAVLSVPFYKTDPLNLVALWKKENLNPAIPLFTNLLI